MTELFKPNQAAKMILAEMIKSNIPFNESWADYNNTWYDNTLKESDKKQVRQFILDALDRWH
jgi:hypothetical protein